jgi:hypothetical protein
MKLSAIEKQVVANIHGLPLDKQQSVLDYSLFLINKVQKDKQEDTENNSVSFGVFLKQFLKEVELEPLDIDTSIFDRDRPQDSGREIEL